MELPADLEVETTTAAKVCELINAECESSVLPMDGYHYYRKQLDEMENPEEVIDFWSNLTSMETVCRDIQSAKKPVLKLSRF